MQLRPATATTSENAPTKPLARVVGRPFAKGQSGNPNGRAKGSMSFANALWARLDNGAKVVEYLARLIEGTEPGARHHERLKAAELAMDRKLGRAVETSIAIELQANGSSAAAQLTDAQLAALADSLRPHALTAGNDARNDVVDAEVVSSPAESDNNPGKIE